MELTPVRSPLGFNTLALPVEPEIRTFQAGLYDLLFNDFLKCNFNIIFMDCMFLYKLPSA